MGVLSSVTRTIERSGYYVQSADALVTRELDEPSAATLNRLVYDKARELETGFYDLSELLYSAWYGVIWKALGVDSWDTWLAGVRLYRGQASDMIRVAELRRQFPDYTPRILDTPPSNMRLLLPHLQQDKDSREYCITDNTLDEYLDDANTMTWRQLRDHLNDGMDPTNVQFNEIPCPHCGSVIRVDRPVKVLAR